MSDAPRSTDELAPLWRDILADLRDVFDVHFVCATFAYHAARYTRTRALVAVADSQAKCYDVWLTEPSGRATQMRWLIDEAGLESLVALNEPTPIDKLERPAAEIIGGQIWLLVKRRLLAAPPAARATPLQRLPARPAHPARPGGAGRLGAIAARTG